MSERIKGNPFENLGATDLTIDEREKPKEDQVVIPEKMKKQRRIPTSILSKKTKPRKKEEPVNPYGYSEVDLEDHLVVDDSELNKLGNWLDEELDKNPKPKGVIEVVDRDDYLYEKQFREQDEITEKRIAEEEAFERRVAEKLDSLDENSELINDPRTQQSIADRVRSSIPKITPEQFQEGIKWKNIPNYEPGKTPESEATIEKNRRKPKKPLKIIDEEFSESDLVSNKSEDVVKNEIVQVEKNLKKRED